MDIIDNLFRETSVPVRNIPHVKDPQVFNPDVFIGNTIASAPTAIADRIWPDNIIPELHPSTAIVVLLEKFSVRVGGG